MPARFQFFASVAHQIGIISSNWNSQILNCDDKEQRDTLVSFVIRHVTSFVRKALEPFPMIQIS